MAFLKEGKTNWKFIIIILAFAILVGGGILLLAKIQEVLFTQLPEIKNPEKSPQDKTADWKTFTNKRNGFEIKYPKDWEVESIELAGHCPGCADIYKFKSSNIQIIIGGSMTWEVVKENFIEGITGISEKITIDGLSAIKRVGTATKFSPFTQFEGKGVIEIIFMKDETLFHLFTTKEEDNAFNQILSTFKFIEKEEELE